MVIKKRHTKKNSTSSEVLSIITNSRNTKQPSKYTITQKNDKTMDILGKNKGKELLKQYKKPKQKGGNYMLGSLKDWIFMKKQMYEQQYAKMSRWTIVKLYLLYKLRLVTDAEYRTYKAQFKARHYFVKMRKIGAELSIQMTKLFQGEDSLIRKVRDKIYKIFYIQQKIEKGFKEKSGKMFKFSHKKVKKYIELQDKYRDKLMKYTAFNNNDELSENCVLGHLGEKLQTFFTAGYHKFEKIIICNLAKYRHLEAQFNLYYNKFRKQFENFLAFFPNCQGAIRKINILNIDILDEQKYSTFDFSKCAIDEINRKNREIFGKVIDVNTDFLPENFKEKTIGKSIQYDENFINESQNFNDLMKTFNDFLEQFKKAFALAEFYGIHRYWSLLPREKTVIGTAKKDVVEIGDISRLSKNPLFKSEFKKFLDDIDIDLGLYDEETKEYKFETRGVTYKAKQMKNIIKIIDKLVSYFSFGKKIYLKRELGCLSFDENSPFAVRNYSNAIKEHFYTMSFPAFIETYLNQISVRFNPSQGGYYSENEITMLSSGSEYNIKFDEPLRLMENKKKVIVDLSLRWLLIPSEDFKKITDGIDYKNIDLEAKYSPKDYEGLSETFVNNFYVKARQLIISQLNIIVQNITGGRVGNHNKDTFMGLIEYFKEEDENGSLIAIQKANNVLYLYQYLFTALRLNYINKQMEMFAKRNEPIYKFEPVPEPKPEPKHKEPRRENRAFESSFRTTAFSSLMETLSMYIPHLYDEITENGLKALSSNRKDSIERFMSEIKSIYSKVSDINDRVKLEFYYHILNFLINVVLHINNTSEPLMFSSYITEISKILPAIIKLKDANNSISNALKLFGDIILHFCNLEKPVYDLLFITSSPHQIAVNYEYALAGDKKKYLTSNAEYGKLFEHYFILQNSVNQIKDADKGKGYFDHNKDNIKKLIKNSYKILKGKLAEIVGKIKGNNVNDVTEISEYYSYIANMQPFRYFIINYLIKLYELWLYCNYYNNANATAIATGTETGTVTGTTAETEKRTATGTETRTETNSGTLDKKTLTEIGTQRKQININNIDKGNELYQIVTNANKVIADFNVKMKFIDKIDEKGKKSKKEMIEEINFNKSFLNDKNANEIYLIFFIWLSKFKDNTGHITKFYSYYRQFEPNIKFNNNYISNEKDNDFVKIIYKNDFIIGVIYEIVKKVKNNEIEEAKKLYNLNIDQLKLLNNLLYEDNYIKYKKLKKTGETIKINLQKINYTELKNSFTQIITFILGNKEFIINNIRLLEENEFNIINAIQNNGDLSGFQKDKKPVVTYTNRESSSIVRSEDIVENNISTGKNIYEIKIYNDTPKITERKNNLRKLNSNFYRQIFGYYDGIMNENNEDTIKITVPEKKCTIRYVTKYFDEKIFIGKIQNVLNEIFRYRSLDIKNIQKGQKGQKGQINILYRFSSNFGNQEGINYPWNFKNIHVLNINIDDFNVLWEIYKQFSSVPELNRSDEIKYKYYINKLKENLKKIPTINNINIDEQDQNLKLQEQNFTQMVDATEENKCKLDPILNKTYIFIYKQIENIIKNLNNLKESTGIKFVKQDTADPFSNKLLKTIEDYKPKYWELDDETKKKIRGTEPNEEAEEESDVFELANTVFIEIQNEELEYKIENKKIDDIIKIYFIVYLKIKTTAEGLLNSITIENINNTELCIKYLFISQLIYKTIQKYIENKNTDNIKLDKLNDEFYDNISDETISYLNNLINKTDDNKDLNDNINKYARQIIYFLNENKTNEIIAKFPNIEKIQDLLPHTNGGGIKHIYKKMMVGGGNNIPDSSEEETPPPPSGTPQPPPSPTTQPPLAQFPSIPESHPLPTPRILKEIEEKIKKLNKIDDIDDTLNQELFNVVYVFDIRDKSTDILNNIDDGDKNLQYIPELHKALTFELKTTPVDIGTYNASANFNLYLLLRYYDSHTQNIGKEFDYKNKYNSTKTQILHIDTSKIIPNIFRTNTDLSQYLTAYNKLNSATLKGGSTHHKRFTQRKLIQNSKKTKFANRNKKLKNATKRHYHNAKRRTTKNL